MKSSEMVHVFKSRWVFGLVSMVALPTAACGGGEAPPPETPHTKKPVSFAMKEAMGDSAPNAPSKGGYSGHGATSVSKDVLAKFAPTPLPDEIARTFQSLLDIRSPHKERLSPDGKTMYLSWTVTGTRQIWRLDGPQRFPTQMTGGEEETLLEDIAPDGSFLVVSRDAKGEENPGLYLQDAKGGPLTLVARKPGVRAFYDFMTDDGRSIYYRTNDVKPNYYVIYRYDRASKTREVVLDQEGLWAIADHKGSPVSKLLLKKEVGSDMAEIFEYDIAKKALTPLFGQGEREDYEVAYGAKDGEILVNTPHLSEFARLYRWDASEKKFTPITPEIPHDIAADGERYNLPPFVIDRAKKRIAYTVNENGYYRLKIIDARTYKDITPKALSSLTGDQITFGTSTRDARFLTINVDTGRGPLSSYVYDWTKGVLTPWHTSSSPELDPAKFAVAKLESYPARDGTPIPMFVRRPDPSRCATKPCPVVVAFHGGPESQAIAGFSAVKQAYVDAGFIYVEPNVRGSKGYGKKWLHADDGAKRLDVITDIEDAAKYIRANWTDGGKAPKVGVMGGSYGGYSTLAAMTMFAGAYDAGVSIVGISNMVTFLENTAPYRRILRISEYGDPQRDRDALVKLSPITHVDRISAPLLVIQGATDPRVPVGEALQIYDVLQKKNVPGGLIIFADEGHGAKKRDNRVLQYGHTLRFFKEHLLK